MATATTNTTTTTATTATTNTTNTPATTATLEDETAQNPPFVANVANVATLRPCQKLPDTDAFDERAAIAEYDGGLSRADAEDLAAQSQGYANVVAFKAAQTNLTKGNEND